VKMRLADVNDEELLKRYYADAQEEAFGELVRRYFNLVWSAAWRVTCDADLARDVAQTVFVDLARKAGHFPGKVILAGWLYRAASLAAIKVVRTNVRRAERERKSMEIESHANTSPTAEPEVDLLMPMLDEDLGKLGEIDRNALVLRFFARKNLSDVGAALGMSDDAAQKRLVRALEKVRRYFCSRGLAVSTGAIVATLGIAGAEAAPAGLSLIVASSSLGVAGSSSVPDFCIRF
jgi:RNA polymerase sigma factor (sigma-70 family)